MEVEGWDGTKFVPCGFVVSDKRAEGVCACCGEGCGAQVGSDLGMKTSSLCIDWDARKNSPEGFSLWGPHGLCWCFNPSTVQPSFQSSNEFTNKRMESCKQIFLCQRLREDTPVVHAMRQQLSLPTCWSII